MPWTTPTLRSVRELARGELTSALKGATFIGNAVLRVMADVNAAMAHLVLRYLDWMAKQFLPDTSEKEWLDRHGNIWLTNSDNTSGRKAATFASGKFSMTGIPGIPIPAGVQFSGPVGYETINAIVLSTVATEVSVRALDPGSVGNLDVGETVSLLVAMAGVDIKATVVSMSGGADEETDDELRERVLERIRNPPMGGDADDYVRWTKAVAGVTRAWSYPLEMGIGTVTVRFMCDDLRATENDGFPLDDDVKAVTDYLNVERPVAVKDFFVVAPIKQEIEFTVKDLETDDEATRAAIESSVKDMLYVRAQPGQMIYRSWVGEAVSQAIGEDHHTLVFENTSMESPGHMAVLGSIIYG